MRDIDVICAGLAVVNFPIRPVDESVFTRDLTQVEPITVLPGGDAVNQAIVLSNLGAKVSLASVIGKDGFGVSLVQMMKERCPDIDLDHLAIDDEDSTGVCAMLIQPNGQRNFCINRGALLKFGLKYMDLTLLERTRVLSLGGFMSFPGLDGKGSETLFRRAKEKGVITVADTKKDLWGIGLEGIRSTLPYIDYFFPSVDEAKEVSKRERPEEMAEQFLQAGAKHVGIKLGGDGCYYRDADQEFYLPAYPCEVVDTTGSGDNFMAGFITGLLQGWEAKRCCSFASAVGAINAMHVGPNEAIHSMQQVLDFQERSLV